MHLEKKQKSNLDFHNSFNTKYQINLVINKNKRNTTKSDIYIPDNILNFTSMALL